ncbi:DNA-binding HxlR family transcriptional regulator [Nocardiopsis mwathae]|uniref:DNA-binding HxlR family transcriptional regulator n=1 Tax=Nocardiopsis mwathae TaxID=1472723 RepID=A0A7W9YGZ6_9ACTN|nr:helix-turn-helix domain-containing protein [Nocardiopsis mwathae]MBB6171899.1 DNA-binding HxlR family transcriptional regulator [Nocardiopsis mwathae]
MSESAAHPSTPITGPTDSGDAFGDLAFDVFAKRCPSRTALENITGRWGVLVLAALKDGPYRFNALRRRVDGVSEKMLSQTLHALERDGLVIRDVQQQIPPRVEYRLTPLGADTAGKLLDLVGLLEGRMDEVLAARSAYDAARG